PNESDIPPRVLAERMAGVQLPASSPYYKVNATQPPGGARGLGYELGLLRPRTPRPSRARALRAHKAAGRAAAAGAQGNEPGSSLPSHRGTGAPATRSPGLEQAPEMPAIAVLAAAAAAWCFLQVDSRHLDALAGGAALNNANFLDNDQWLSTVSQYDRDKYWNRFRDPERNFKENLEGRMLLRATCGPGVCTCRIDAAVCIEIGREP
ncbi:hypothetical protein A6R68_04859, partial [Neotoma lepida]